jgi:hypothetical protein
MGALGLVLAAGGVVIGIKDLGRGYGLSLALGAVTSGVLVWAALLRPRVWATRENLVMRNMLHTVRIPLVAIETVAVRQVLAVTAGERRFVSPAIGRTLRQIVKGPRGQEYGMAVHPGMAVLGQAGSGDTGSGEEGRRRPAHGEPRQSGRATARMAATAYPNFVEERIVQLADEACARRGVRRFSDEQAALAAGVRRTWAWPEIAAIAVFGVACLVSLLV